MTMTFHSYVFNAYCIYHVLFVENSSVAVVIKFSV